MAANSGLECVSIVFFELCRCNSGLTSPQAYYSYIVLHNDFRSCGFIDHLIARSL